MTNEQLEIMEKSNLRIEVCEHTNKPIVQEKFGEEWVCIHEDTRKQELDNIKQVLRKMKKYSIKVWETEQDRDAGESFIAEIIQGLKEAIEKAEKMYYKQDFSAIEVIDENDKVILHLSSNE